MNWPLVYSTLAAVAQQSGITDANAITWDQQGASGAWIIGAGAGAKLSMAITQTSSKGIDFEEYVDNAPANQTVTVVGQRQFMWEIRADAQSGDPAKFALAYLDKLRARLNRTTTDALLTAAGIALVELHPTMRVNYVADGRAVVRYVMDVLMAAAENDVDTTVNAGGYIAVVNVASNTLKNPDGTDKVPQISLQIGP